MINIKRYAKRLVRNLSFLHLFIFSFLIACTTIDCPVQNTVYTVYTLQTAEGKADTLRDTMYVFSKRKDNKDTIIFNAGIDISKFTLPISYANPEDTLYFLLRNSGVMSLDTVWIKKENYPHFESVDCSAAFFHKITDVRSTHNGIDSITINKRDVNYDAKTEHFHIYLKDIY